MAVACDTAGPEVPGGVMKTISKCLLHAWFQFCIKQRAFITIKCQPQGLPQGLFVHQRNLHIPFAKKPSIHFSQKSLKKLFLKKKNEKGPKRNVFGVVSFFVIAIFGPASVRVWNIYFRSSLYNGMHLKYSAIPCFLRQTLVEDRTHLSDLSRRFRSAILGGGRGHTRNRSSYCFSNFKVSDEPYSANDP